MMTPLPWKSVFMLTAVLVFQTSSPVIIKAAEVEQGWKVIGVRPVNEKAKIANIPVGARKGTFDQVRIQVTKSPLEISHIVLHFEDDTQQSIPYGKTFKPGTTSRNVQIKSGAQGIEKVTVHYSEVGMANSNKVRPFKKKKKKKDKSKATPLPVAKKPTLAVWGRLLKETDPE